MPDEPIGCLLTNEHLKIHERKDHLTTVASPFAWNPDDTGSELQRNHKPLLYCFLTDKRTRSNIVDIIDRDLNISGLDLPCSSPKTQLFRKEREKAQNAK
jgi:hypothetical protein